jgi:hypothetical protein
MEKPSKRNLFDDDSSDGEDYMKKVGGGILDGGDPVVEEKETAQVDPVPESNLIADAHDEDEYQPGGQPIVDDEYNPMPSTDD